MAFCVDAGSRSLSDDILHLKTNAIDSNATVKYNALKKSNSCNLSSHTSKEDNFHKNSFNCSLSFDKVKIILIFYLLFFVYINLFLLIEQL